MMTRRKTSKGNRLKKKKTPQKQDQKLKKSKSLVQNKIPEESFLFHKLALVSQYSQNIIFITDIQGRIEWVNESFTRVTGYSFAEVIGKKPSEILTGPETDPSTVKLMSASLAKGKGVDVEILNYTKSHQKIWLATAVEPIHDEKGTVIGFFAVENDITEKKLTEQSLQESEERYRALIQNLPIGLYRNTPGPQGSFIMANPAIARMFGYDTVAEFLKSNVADLYRNPLERQAFSQKLMSQGYVDKENLYLKKHDGTFLLCAITARAYRDESGNVSYFDGAIEDITERKQMEEALREREETFRTITSSAQDGIIMMNSEGEIFYWNKAAETIFGWSNEQILGKNLHNFLAPKKYHAAFEEGFKAFKESGKGNAIGKTLELSALRKDGTEIPIEISLASVNLKGKWNAVGILRDITERKHAEEELRKAKEAAETAARTKSEFLANMSHEIRTPLNAIVGMTGLLVETKLNNVQREYAEIVHNSSDVLLGIINDILDYSKIEAGKFEFECIDFDLRCCVEEVGDLLGQKAYQKGLELAILVQPQVPERVNGDPGRLRQVLLNLVNNALKFTEKGEVVIRVMFESLNDRFVTLKFSVTDTGIGIPSDRMHRLFQSFSQVDSSTTRKYGGTGLGLAISKQLVEMMHGRIHVESKEGKGSTFWFTSEFSRAKSDPNRKMKEMKEVAGARILFVDDNPTNRQVLREMLKLWKCQYDEASDGLEALKKIKQVTSTPNAFELVLVDYNMPKMDGAELARHIKADPTTRNIPLMLLTSSPQMGDAKKMQEMGFVAYLTKPLKHSHLYDAMATILGGVKETKTIVDQKPLITKHTLKEIHRSKTRILVVEDNLVNQKVATHMLEKLGYRCDVAGNGLEAVKTLELIPYNIVFMDCQMPEMDGYEATREIRKREGKDRHTPIVAMTAEALKGDRERCIASGMDNYLSKPIQLNALQSILEQYLGETKNAGSSSITIEEKTAPIDLQRLKEVAGEDREFEKELMNLFLKESVLRKNAIANALQQENMDMLSMEAHTLKGTSGNIGSTRLQELATQLQYAAKNKDLSRCNELFQELVKALEVVQIFLREQLHLEKND